MGPESKATRYGLHWTPAAACEIGQTALTRLSQRDGWWRRAVSPLRRWVGLAPVASLPAEPARHVCVAASAEDDRPVCTSALS